MNEQNFESKKYSKLSPLDKKLMIAVGDWNISAIRECIREGANINCIDGYGYTPLINAIDCYRWHGLTCDEVDKLSKEDNKKLEKINLKKSLVIAEFLLQNGADINLCGKDNIAHTPLMTAIWDSSTEMVKFLLEHGEKVNYVVPEDGEYGSEVRSDPMYHFDWLIYEDYDDEAEKQHHLIREYGGRLYQYNWDPENHVFLDRYYVQMVPGNKKDYVLFDNDRWGVGQYDYLDIEDNEVNKTRIDLSSISDTLREWNNQFIANAESSNEDYDWKAWRKRGQELAKEILRLSDNKIVLFYLYGNDDIVCWGHWHPDHDYTKELVLTSS